MADFRAVEIAVLGNHKSSNHSNSDGDRKGKWIRSWVGNAGGKGWNSYVHRNYSHMGAVLDDKKIMGSDWNQLTNLYLGSSAETPVDSSYAIPGEREHIDVGKCPAIPFF